MNKAFTLAETLITLGIIGVVAAYYNVDFGPKICVDITEQKDYTGCST